MQHFIIPANHVSFAEYIRECVGLVSHHRSSKKQIIANSPFELMPDIAPDKKINTGVLLIHGLLDSPSSLYEIGQFLCQHGMLVRAVLLPGHGTVPEDLLHVTYHDWIRIVTYGICSLKQAVNQIFLLGFSTGAMLALYTALKDKDIAGIIQISPVFRLKANLDLLIRSNYLFKLVTKNRKWLIRQKEMNDTRYLSIPFQAVYEVCMLSKKTLELNQKNHLTCPVYMIISKEDQTVSSRAALHYFKRYLTGENNRLLIYTTHPAHSHDQRITIHDSRYPDLHIQSFSHISLTKPPDGIQRNNAQAFYGSYHALFLMYAKQLYRWGFLKHPHKELTFNPDFDFMVKSINEFISLLKLPKQII